MAAVSTQGKLDFQTILEATNQHQGTTYTHLKEKQKEALLACLSQDVTCVLPTGYGKTVVIHLLPFLNPEKPAAVLLITPLNAIIEEQRNRFGTSCIVIDSQLVQDLDEDVTSEEITRLKEGRFTFLLGHPERIIEPAVRRILMTPPVASKITHIVVDEAHCILSWGKSDFRPALKEVHCLRATLPEAKMVALTATATVKAVEEICRALQMQKPALVKASPDRPSVYIEVRRRTPSTGGDYCVFDSYMECVNPMLQELKAMEGSLPRTIIYMPLKWCGYSHYNALGVLKDCTSFQAIQKETDEEIKSFVAQYHSPQTAEMKQLISKSMLLPDNPLRLLFATEAFGMGADSPNVRRVVHAGPPSNLETYIQEIGRAGRDGKPAEAILYFNNSDLSVNKAHLTDSMREFCRLPTCRRKYLMTYFGFELAATEKEKCCDICRGICHPIPDKPKPLKPMRHISLTLQEYFEDENDLLTDSCLPDITSGLCQELADDISCQPELYADGSHLQDDFPFLKQTYINNIKILLSMFVIKKSKC